MEEQVLNAFIEQVIVMPLDEIDYVFCSIRDAINKRADSEDFISSLNDIGVYATDEACRRKKPSPPPK